VTWAPGEVATIRDAGRARTEQREADVVAWVHSLVSLVVEARWTDRAGLDDLAQLRAGAAAVPDVSGSTRLAMFAWDSFSDRLRVMAEQEGILLFSITEMLEAVR
jgi:hypothetical protein